MDNSAYNQALTGSSAPRSVLRQVALYALERRRQPQPDMLMDGSIDPVLEKLDFTSFEDLERKLGLWPAVAVAQQIGTKIPPLYPPLISKEWQRLDKKRVLLSGLWLDSLVNMGLSPVWRFDVIARDGQLLNINLSGLDLRWSDLTLDKVIDVEMTRCSLCGSNISNASFARCDASHADFRKCTLDQVSISDCDLRFANFSGSHMKCAFRKTDISNAIFDGTNLKGGYFSEVTAQSASFKDANMPQTGASFVDFSGSDLSGLFAPASDFVRCKFAQANLSDADFKASSFSGSFFKNSNLSGANLTGVIMERTEIGHCDLSGANLHKADLSHMSFWKVNFEGADFTETDLTSSFLDPDCSFIGTVGWGTHRSHHELQIKHLWS